MKQLIEVLKILSKQRKFMANFIENYMFRQVNVPLDKDMIKEDNFLKVVDFCLNTRQRMNSNEYRKAKTYFANNYKNFNNFLKEKDIDNLKKLVYKAPGVGQKIGSLILEVFIHYGKLCPSIEKELFVPIDTHVERIFKDSFNLCNVPTIGSKYTSRRFVDFQNFLKENTAKGESRIIFDYLWFIGKVFCTKINYNSEIYSRGYRLCSMCWIKDYCKVENKWL